MGIHGLLPFLKKIHNPVHISQFKGCTVAIDAYCWLHKGAFSCADKLALGEKTEQYVYYCMKYIECLLNNGLNPILVFDGCNLPSKKDVESSRRERRDVHRRKAAQLLREGRRAEAKECLQRSVDITPQMALQLINVIFKMDFFGNGILIERRRLNEVTELQSAFYTFEKFRYMCILSGCDYLSSLPGIGLIKACKVFRVARETDIRRVLRKLTSYLKINIVVSDGYIEGFVRANHTFLYQLIFDPITRELRPLNPYPLDLSPEELVYAGAYFSNTRALQIALGNVDINTHQKIASFDPDVISSKGFARQRGAIKMSIWSAGFCPTSPKNFEMLANVKYERRPCLAGKEEELKNPVRRRSPCLRLLPADDSSCNLSHHELLAMYSRGEAPVVKKKKRCAINDAENAPPLYSDVVSLDTFRHAQPGPCYENVSSASTLTYTSPDKQTRCRLAGEDVLCIEKDSVVWGKEKESGTCIQGHKHNKFAVLECDGKKRFHLDGHILPPNVAVLVRSRYFDECRKVCVGGTNGDVVSSCLTSLSEDACDQKAIIATSPSSRLTSCATSIGAFCRSSPCISLPVTPVTLSTHSYTQGPIPKTVSPELTRERRLTHICSHDACMCTSAGDGASALPSRLSGESMGGASSGIRLCSSAAFNWSKYLFSKVPTGDTHFPPPPPVSNVPSTPFQGAPTVSDRALDGKMGIVRDISSPGTHDVTGSTNTDSGHRDWGDGCTLPGSVGAASSNGMEDVCDFDDSSIRTLPFTSVERDIHAKKLPWFQCARRNGSSDGCKANYFSTMCIKGSEGTQESHMSSVEGIHESYVSSVDGTQGCYVGDVDGCLEIHVDGIEGTKDSYVGSVVGSQDSHVGSVVGSQDSHVGSVAGSQDSHVGSVVGSQDSHVGSVVGSQDSHVGSVVGSQDSHVGSVVGSQDSHVCSVEGTQFSYMGSVERTQYSHVGSVEGNRECYVCSVDESRDSHVCCVEGTQFSYVGSVDGNRESYVGSVEGNRECYVGSVDESRGSHVCSVEGTQFSYVGSVEGTRESYVGSVEGNRECYVGSVYESRDSHVCSVEGTQFSYVGSVVGSQDSHVGSVVGSQDSHVGSVVGSQDSHVCSVVGSQDSHVGSVVGSQDSHVCSVERTQFSYVGSVEGTQYSHVGSVAGNRECYVGSVDESRNSHVCCVEGTQFSYVGSVEGNRESCVGSVEGNRECYVGSVDESRDSHVCSVEGTQFSHVGSVEGTRESYVDSVDETRDSHVCSGEGTRSGVDLPHRNIGDGERSVSWSQCCLDHSSQHTNSQSSNVCSLDSDCWPSSQEIIDLTARDQVSNVVSKLEAQPTSLQVATGHLVSTSSSSPFFSSQGAKRRRCRVSGLSKVKKNTRLLSGVSPKQPSIHDMLSRFAH